MVSKINGKGRCPLALPDGVGSSADAKCLAEAGFEAGLSVMVAAFPTASLVIDGNQNVVVANIASAALKQHIKQTDARTRLCASLMACQMSKEAVTTEIVDDTGARAPLVVVPLVDPNVKHKRLFLITLSPDATVGHQAVKDKNAMMHYEVAPTSARALREEAAKFKRLSETDPLTGALNVRAFSERVQTALRSKAMRKGAMIFLDLNHFKEINDKFGHAVGDRVLMHVAAKLTFPCHTMIATARMGGDEFALWMPGIERTHVHKMIDGVRDRLQMPIDVSECGQEAIFINPTAAVGAVTCPEEALNYDMMRNLADQRMYEDKAKITRRSRHCASGISPKRKGAVDPAPQSFLPR